MKFLLAMLFAVTIAGSAYAVGLTIPAGETVNVDAGTLNIEGDLIINGTLTVTTGTVSVTGNWTNNGTFTAGTGTVQFNGTRITNVSGNTTFYNLRCVTPNKTIRFAAANSFTISNTLSINGQSKDTQIVLDSDGNGRFTLNVTGGEQTIYYAHISNASASSNDIRALNSIDAGNNDSSDSSPHWVFGEVDGVNTVYDIVTGEAIEGAELTLYTPTGLIYAETVQPNPQFSKADGTFEFDSQAGSYFIVAKKDGYNDFTSLIFQVTGTKVDQDISMAPLNSVGPSDNTQTQYLTIRHTVNKKIATTGDIVTYTVKVTNITSSATVSNVTVTAILPHDFKYAPQSSVIDGVLSVEPTNRKNPSWNVGTINTKKTKTLTYRVIIGPDAKIGKNKNYASATGSASGSSTEAGPSIAELDVREGLFCKKELVLGKVFYDDNKNGIQDEKEKGTSNASLIMEDGKTVVTDEHGRFSIPEVSLGTHIIRLEPRVLPGGPLTKESTLMEWEKHARKDAKGELHAESQRSETENESLIERRKLGDWVKQTLFAAKKKEETASSEKKTGEESRYRPEIPRVSKFFRVYETQTTKVNIPIPRLSEEETAKLAEKDKRETQFMLIALADGEFGYLAGGGNVQNLKDGSGEGFENSFYKDGYAKVYLKGKIKGSYFLTMRYDSEQDYQDHLFEYINPEKYYPIYGDGSNLYDEADSQGKFYVKLERADTQILYGNFSTEEFTQTELSKYGRTLSGAKAHIETKDFGRSSPEGKPNLKLDLFGSETRQDKREDLIAARGVSGPYFLTRRSIIEYTELVRIETRDGSRTDIVLSSDRKTLDEDYEIDYAEARIMFKEPIPTNNENGDPVFIVVDYEYVPEARDLDHYIAGVRSELTYGEFGPEKLMPKVKLGSQFISEQKDAEKLRLVGVDGTTELFPGTSVSGEVAHTDDLLNKGGNAWRIEGSTKLFKEKIHGQAYAAEIDPNFRNPTNVTESATQKYGLTAQVKPLSDVSVIIDHYKNRSIKTHTFDRDTKFDLYYERDSFILGTGYDFREFVDEDDLTYDITNHSIRFEGGFKFTPNFIGSGQYKIEKENEDGHWRQTINTISPRVDFRLDDNTSLYGRHDFRHEKTKGEDRSFNSNISVIGLMRVLQEGITNYVEYGFVGARILTTTLGQNINVPLTDKLSLSANNSKVLSKDKNEENMGYAAKWQVLKDFFVNFLFERNKTTGDERYNSNSKSLTFEYRPEGSLNTIGLKLENRYQLELAEYNIDGNSRIAINDSLYLVSRTQFQLERERSGSQTNRMFQRIMGGLAYRPVHNDKLNMLAKYEYSRDMDKMMESEVANLTKHIISAEAIYDFLPDVEFYGKYAMKWVGEDGGAIYTDTVTDVVTGRIRYKMTDWLDLAGIYHILKNRDTATMKQGIQAEMGVVFAQRMRLAAGWNFTDYDDDEIENESYMATGPYLNMTMALMEDELEGMPVTKELMRDKTENLKDRILRYRVRYQPEDEKLELNEKFKSAEKLYKEGKSEEAKEFYEDITLKLTQMKFDIDSYVKSEFEKGKTAAEILKEVKALYIGKAYRRGKPLADLLWLSSRSQARINWMDEAGRPKRYPGLVSITKALYEYRWRSGQGRRIRASRKEVEKLGYEGRRLYREKKYDEAIARFQEVLYYEPDNSSAKFYIELISRKREL